VVEKLETVCGVGLRPACAGTDSVTIHHLKSSQHTAAHGWLQIHVVISGTVTCVFKRKEKRDLLLFQTLPLVEDEPSHLYSFNERTLCPLNTLRTNDADLRFYITTVQDG
jgi:hypothetical protein